MDDIKIISLLRQDPERGLSTLITKYARMVKRISYGILAGHSEDIEEVTADTFISIWKNAAKFDPDRGSLKSLIAITARNNAINRCKLLQRPTAATAELIEDAYQTSSDGLAELLAMEDTMELQQAVNLLPEPDKEIFVRRHYLLESVKDIACRMNMDEKQISNRLYKSKLHLRNTLNERSEANE